jgi:hypothetical protein
MSQQRWLISPQHQAFLDLPAVRIAYGSSENTVHTT